MRRDRLKKHAEIEKYTTYGRIAAYVITRRRKKLTLSQEQMARLLGLGGQSGYSRVEKGASSLTLGTLRAVAAQLGQSPSDVLREADELVNLLTKVGVQVLNCGKPEAGKGGGAPLMLLLDGSVLADLIETLLAKKKQ
jgi:transcriptional regulator with XRE-family HTH domain